MATQVKLRRKKIANGKESLYLDFYPPVPHPKTGKPTRREFLTLYIYSKPKGALQKQENKATLQMAESIRSKRYLELLNGVYGLDANSKKDMSFTDFFREQVKKRYSTKSNHDNWLSSYHYFEDFFEDDLSMGDLSVESIEDFKDYLESLDLAQNTKHSYFSKFKAAIKEAFVKGYLPENYATRVSNIKAEETKREFVTWEELQLLAKTDCENEVLKNAFMFSALTGLRFSDIQKLTWGDLQGNEQDGYFIRFRQKKTKGEETLPIPKLARDLIGEEAERKQPIFQGLHYSAWNNKKLKAWVEAAGITKKITFHCARHSFATIQLTLGTDLTTISKLLGHKDIKTTQIYAKVIDKKKIEAMNKLDGFEL